MLLRAGADIETTDENGYTPLLYAASRNNPEIVATLLRAGADAKAKNKRGYTAFDYAQYNVNLKGTDVLQILEEASQ